MLKFSPYQPGCVSPTPSHRNSSAIGSLRNRLIIFNNIRRLTVPQGMVFRAEARASQPIMRAISWTKTFVSRALASFERSWESLARRHGCVETWMFDGKEDGGNADNML